MSEIPNRSDFLKLLTNSNTKRRNILIDTATNNEINALVEIFYNIANGNIKLKPAQLKKFNRYRKHIRKIIDKKTKTSAKKKVIKQTGGIIGLLMGLLASSYLYKKYKKLHTKSKK